MAGESYVSQDPQQGPTTGRPPSHGVDAFLERGPAALSVGDRAVLAELRRDLEAPEGVRQAQVELAARGLMIVGMIERYIATQVADGKALGSIALLTRWPSFFSAVGRAVARLGNLQKGQDTPRDVGAMLDALGKAGSDDVDK